MKASERLRELNLHMANLEKGYDRRFAASFKADELFAALPLIADVVEAAESVYADNEDGEIGIALWPALTALTAALQPEPPAPDPRLIVTKTADGARVSPPPPEGATAP